MELSGGGEETITILQAPFLPPGVVHSCPLTKTSGISTISAQHKMVFYGDVSSEDVEQGLSALHCLFGCWKVDLADAPRTILALGISALPALMLGENSARAFPPQAATTLLPPSSPPPACLLVQRKVVS